jgi:hypothetical protein
VIVAYGTACALVCLVSFAHRASVPYAIILAAGWIAGFLPLETWSFISLAQGAAMACFLKWRSPLWQRIVVACVPLMLLADGYFWLAQSMGQYPGVYYENTLNVLFIIQLACTAYPGGRAIVRRVRAWLGSVFDGRGRSVGLGVWQAVSADWIARKNACIVSYRRAYVRPYRGLFVPARED